jgi:hypothetical protein
MLCGFVSVTFFKDSSDLISSSFASNAPTASAMTSPAISITAAAGPPKSGVIVTEVTRVEIVNIHFLFTPFLSFFLLKYQSWSM